MATAKKKVRKRLSNIMIERVSLVPAGDDTLANVVLSKSKSAVAGEGTDPNREGETMPTIRKSDLPDEAVEYIEALEAEVTRLQKGADTDDSGDDDDVTTDEEVDDAIDDFDDEDDGDEDDEDEDAGDDPGTPAAVEKVLSKADPAVRRLMKSLAVSNRELRKENKANKQRADQALKEIAKERGIRQRAERLQKAKDEYGFVGDPDDLVALMGVIEGSGDTKVAETFEKVLKGANARIESGNIFDELGKTGAMTVGDEGDKAIADLKKSDPKLTDAEAFDKWLTANPHAYDQMIGE